LYNNSKLEIIKVLLFFTNYGYKAEFQQRVKNVVFKVVIKVERLYLLYNIL